MLIAQDTRYVNLSSVNIQLLNYDFQSCLSIVLCFTKVAGLGSGLDTPVSYLIEHRLKQGFSGANRVG